MDFLTIATPVTYWILIILWTCILAFYIKRLRSNVHKGQLIFVLIAILAVDAFRTLFESLYFGAWYTSVAGFLPEYVYAVLVRPEMVFIPKIINVIAAIIVIVILIFRWLPKEELEKENLKNLIEKKTHDLKKSNDNLQQEIKEHKKTAQALVNRERKQSDEALQKREGQLRAIFETAINVSFIITDAKDPEPMVLEFSPGAEKIFGYGKSEMLGNPVSILHLPEDVQRFPRAYQQMREGKIGLSGETTLVKKSGKKFPALFSTHPLFDARGKMVAALGVCMDISRQKQLEARIRQSHKMESIGILAGGIAHDFNNILFPIVGFAEILEEDIPQGSPLRENVEEILIGAKRAKELVKQILTFSRQTEHELKPLNPKLVVKEVIKLIKSTLPTTIEVRQNIDGDCRTILADPTQIHQIAMNLITNAYHAMMDSGGVLFITLQNVDPDHYNDLKSAAGPQVLLSIKDTGIGMNEFTLAKIFDPYFTTKSKGKGTGLGLSVVYGIVKEYGGDVLVTSSPGQGSTFDVYLPSLKSDEIFEKSSGGNISPKGTEKILLVDDELAVLRLEKIMLERLGYEVDVISNSKDALAEIKSFPDRYDLMITDMTMPNMTGEQLTLEIRKLNLKMPILICTGFSEKITPERCVVIGADGLLLKPVVKLEMARTIRNILEG